MLQPEMFICMYLSIFFNVFLVIPRSSCVQWKQCTFRMRSQPQMNNGKYLTDIPRQREEYEVIYGTRQNAECHITSVLRAGVECLFYFMTNSRYIFVTK